MEFIYKILQFDTSTNLTIRYIDSVEDSNATNPIDFNSFYYLDANFSINLICILALIPVNTYKKQTKPQKAKPIKKPRSSKVGKKDTKKNMKAAI